MRWLDRTLSTLISNLLLDTGYCGRTPPLGERQIPWSFRLRTPKVSAGGVEYIRWLGISPQFELLYATYLIYGQPKLHSMSNNHHKIGLKERIQSAISTTEVKALLAEGSQFQHASEVTRRAWARAADKRTRELDK